MYMPVGNMAVFSGNANRKLAEEICSYLGIELKEARVDRFSDGEIEIDIPGSVRGKDCYVIQSICPPVNNNLMELVFMIDTLRRASAGRINAIMPYFGYGRQERRKGRQPISARVVADMIEGEGANYACFMDLHTNAIEGFFKIPTDNLFAKPALVKDIRETIGTANLCVVSTDAGGVERARAYAKELGADLAIIDKERKRANQVNKVQVVGDVRGKVCVAVDDIFDTFGTIAAICEALIKAKAKEVHVRGVHAVLSGKAINRITCSEMKSMAVTNTIQLSPEAEACGRIRVISIAKIIGDTMKFINGNGSVSSQFV
jgi:ribose-phosphate pyrophosphokinase